MHSRIGLAAAVFLVAFAVFRISPIQSVFDSRYEMLFSEQLLRHHSFSVDASVIPNFSHFPDQQHQRKVDLPYQFTQVGERFYYMYPPGGVVLSMPFVAIANAMGVSVIDRKGVYNLKNDERIQGFIAPLLMAGLAVFIFLTARMFVSLFWSVIVTAATVFGTQMWSTGSRAVWAQTWSIFILGAVVWLLVRSENKQARIGPILMGTLLSWLYLVRPTFSVPIAAMTIYIAIYRREILLPLILTGLAWLALFVGYSEYHFGKYFPPYYFQGDFHFGPNFFEGLAGNLVSPSRGLLVYVPVLFVVGYLLIRYRPLRKQRLVVLALSVICGHLLVISFFYPWHGGHCYGSRLTTDLVPWFALLGILAIEARLRWHNENPQRDSRSRICAEWSVAILLLACSITLNGIGAISRDAWRWNGHPTDINIDRGRLWDWKHPQFLGAPR